MWNYAARRLLWLIPTLFGVSVIMFSLLHVVPGDPLAGILPLQAGPEIREKLRHELGFDRPLVVQYGSWLKKAVTGDLGRSIATERPVTGEVVDALGNTFILAITAGVLSMALGTILGTIAGFQQGRWLDKLASAIAITGLSLPNYWVAIVLIILFSVVWGVLPAEGMSTIGGAGSGPLDVMKHMVIPVIALMMISLGIITRMVRASVLEVLNQEYVTALRAKGLMPLHVVYHVVKNAAPPVVTVVGLDIGYLLGGSILVEAVVNWPGAGGLLNVAIQQRDNVVIQGTVLVLSAMFVLINLIVDFLNTLIDPRIRRS
jgi:peptide/nickel transport system permease protein